MISPPRWSEGELETERQKAIAAFRTERIEEPLEQYLTYFDGYLEVFEDLLERTVDLRELDDHLSELLSASETCDAVRYLTGPPVSLDDLKVIAEARSLSRSSLNGDPALVARIASLVKSGLDRRRFPWMADEREPTETERTAAIAASAALLAYSTAQQVRRHEGKNAQEAAVEEALLRASFEKVRTRTIAVLQDAPGAGQFCRESILGSRKADLVVGLPDRRVLAIECKVSNSFTNSVKRLNNDAAVKAGIWIKEFGELQVVPSAVLGGAYKLRNLLDAQRHGLTLFWAHDLPSMIRWISVAVV